MIDDRFSEPDPERLFWRHLDGNPIADTGLASFVFEQYLDRISDGAATRGDVIVEVLGLIGTDRAEAGERIVPFIKNIEIIARTVILPTEMDPLCFGVVFRGKGPERRQVGDGADGGLDGNGTAGMETVVVDGFGGIAVGDEGFDVGIG